MIDRPGIATVTQTVEARDFARCAAAHFDAVLHLECGGRPLVEIAGDLAVLMGLPLDRQLPDTLQAFGRLCAGRRLLVVLEDGAGTPWRPADTSVLISTETSAALALTPLRAAQVAFREALARDHWSAAREAGRRAASLASAAGRFAEAFAAWQHLYDDPRADISLLDECCREQAWILEHWGCLSEAERLRDERRRFYADQMTLDFDWPRIA